MEPIKIETELNIGPQAIEAYSRLSYTMWHAFAEFIDNSTQSRFNYGSIVDDVLKSKNQPLTVTITHNRIDKKIAIDDNSIGMTKVDLIEALKIANPTKDSIGRSKYGLGMKTAACWIGRRWSVITCEWGSGEEWTADVDVQAIARQGRKISLSMRPVSKDDHYTKIVITDLHRNIQKKTEDAIRAYLGSMYRFDLEKDRLKIVYNNEEITGPEEYEIDTDPSGKPMRREIPSTTINGKRVSGWVAVLRKGGRRFGGFSIFQNERQIQGFPSAWKPRLIFGGVDDEGANNLVAQRLMGVLDLDGFEVSHTKDSILFEDDEEEELEKLLNNYTKDYRDYAQKRRGDAGTPWSREKVRDLLEGMKKEFLTDELSDTLNHAMLPPIDTIVNNNHQQLRSLTKEDVATTFDLKSGPKVIVSLQERSEHDPHLTIVAGADTGTIHVIINRLHPYYISLESTDAIEECIRQYLYDAISEYRVSKLMAQINQDSVRRLKNDLLRAQILRIENAAAAIQSGQFEPVVGLKGAMN